MTFEEMERRWKAQDEKLDTVLQLNVAHLRAAHEASTALRLDRVRRSLVFELLADIAALLLIGSFLGSHWGDVRYLVPAAVLHVCAILLVASTVHQLTILRVVDYAAPVVAVQRTLMRLRVLRIRTSKWTLMAAPLLWTPLLIVTLKALFGVDVYTFLDPAWIAANVAFGAAFLTLMLWVARRYGDRMERSPRLRALMDDLAGRSLTEVTAFIDRLARFERE